MFLRAFFSSCGCRGWGGASGLDDPGDGLGGFGDHVAGLVLVARGHLLQNVAIGLLDEHVGHCVANPAADLGYGDPRGNARLREVLCGWLATTRGVRTDPDGIIVVAGQRAIAVEDPGSRGARDELAQGDHQLRDGMEKHHAFARELLGVETPAARWQRPTGPDELTATLSRATDNRAQVIALTLVLSSYEADLDVHTWRNPTGNARRYLTQIAAWGYELSDIEQSVTGQAEDGGSVEDDGTDDPVRPPHPCPVGAAQGLGNLLTTQSASLGRHGHPQPSSKNIAVISAMRVPEPAATHAGYLADLLAEEIAEKGPDDLLFCAPEGGPLRPRNWRRRVWEPSGAKVKHVQRMLGHQSAAMTLDVYASLFEDDLDQLTDRQDAAISAAAAAAAASLLPGTPQGSSNCPIEGLKPGLD